MTTMWSVDQRSLRQSGYNLVSWSFAMRGLILGEFGMIPFGSQLSEVAASRQIAAVMLFLIVVILI